MTEKVYSVSFEVEGPAAMFTRPDTGSSPVSYPAPTKSALKSIFECVTFSKIAYFEPQRIEICSPIVFRKYSTNYGGPLRKSGTVNFQLFATILENICYKVYGVILAYSPPFRGKTRSINYRKCLCADFQLVNSIQRPSSDGKSLSQPILARFVTLQLLTNPSI